MENSDDEVLLERRGRLGHILLNRPKAMNAINGAMVNTIASALEAWQADDGVSTVLISGAGERGLCAGGDIVGMYYDALEGGEETARFWADEYALNARIAGYSKPFVAFMDGIVLGGGIGVSAHGSVRIVTERTKFGMPEVGIGFVPDVGGTYLLSRAPGELGTHLALTGGMAGGADALSLGFADHFVPSGRLPELAVALESVPANEAVAAVAAESSASQAATSPLAAQRSWIDRCYSSDSAVEIVRRLQADGSEEAAAAASVILTKSPTGVTVALESLRRARKLATLEEVLDQEYRVSLRFIEGHEIIEGIRAQVIDKDRSPSWRPSSLGEVTRADVEHYFADLGDRELGLTSNQGIEHQSNKVNRSTT